MIVKRWWFYLLMTVLVLVGIMVALGLATRLGFGPLVDAVRREPQRCLFADESTWDICKNWLPQPGAAAQSRTVDADSGDYIKGIYVSHYALGDATFMKRIKDLLETTELNAIVMDVKGDRGYIVYPTQVALAKQIGADGMVMVKDWPAFMQWFKDHNIYTIARIVTFKDNLLSAARPEWSVRDATTG
ncbi:MAG: putative glycoside hydrolase, partial [Anaerolineae bacterium]|nr:putative glycoside hydrolase [Anaerolineae bacterium]